MGKSDRIRKQRRGEAAKTRLQRVAGMAPDTPLPDPSLPYDPQLGRTPLEHREGVQKLRGLEVLQQYLAFVDDEAGRLDEELLAMNPDAALRDIGGLLKVARWYLDGEWRTEAARVVRRIPPSDTHGVVYAIKMAPVAFGSVTNTNYPPDPDDWLQGALPILAAMCPEQHLEAGVQMMELRLAIYGQDGDAYVERYTHAVFQHHVAAIHAEAALAAWVLTQPSIVAEPAQAQLKIANTVLAMYGAR